MLNRPIGSHPDRDEFQIERTIVCVEYRSGADREATLSRANQLFPGIWAAIPQVIGAAEAASRDDMPSFWETHDKAGTAGQQLSVWGIWISVEEGCAEYEVNANHDFDGAASEGPPGLPDGMCFMVARNDEGKLSVRIIS